MTKQLIVEYMPFKPVGTLTEQSGAAYGIPGGFVVQGDDLLGAVQILDTPSGKILKELFKAGITLGISSRGLGSVKELRSEGTVEVQEDFELICWDFVSNPSTHGAFMRPTSMNESVNKPIVNKYSKVNEIITSILCEDGKCRI
jgi:hypothetical protein